MGALENLGRAKVKNRIGHPSEENDLMRRTFQNSTNVPTWSFSRDQLLLSCERKYFFQYLANAYLNSPDPWLREVALLKKLKNIPMWQGECVHEAIAAFFVQMQQAENPGFETVAKGLRQRMQRDWQFSEKRQFREEPASVGRFGAALFEHEYDEVPLDTKIEELIDNATQMLQHFFSWIKEPPSFLNDFKTAKRRWIEPPPWGTGAPGFMVGNVQAITKVDLALHLQNGDFTIYDWKTGNVPKSEFDGSKNERQISVYMLWAHLALNLPFERVTSSLVYLGGNGPYERKYRLDEEVAMETQQIIIDSVEQTQRWENYFKSGRLGLEQLDYAVSVNECRKCNFKRVCRAALTRQELP
jgi:PD-(D/E)XK nuclease superfamily